jgi:drug/metabolite transporter (DMT)-like permease
VVEFPGDVGSLDGVGLAAALGAAGAYAFYILAAERGVRRRDALSLSFHGFAFATLFWLVVQPPWLFPGSALDDTVSLRGNLAATSLPLSLLLLFVIVAGTVVTFGLIAASLRHISATRVGIVATLEPVAGALVAYVWLDQRLTATQLAGGAVVLAGIMLAQTARDR